jgi:RNA-directed DNA polymerase
MHKRPTPFDELCELANLMNAWRQVRANKGAAGVDEVTIVAFERNVVANLQDLAARIREQRYYPLPPRNFEMKKADGRTRTLGIFTIEDRVAQRAALNVLEPLWEPAFAALECNFGFRANRNAEMAVKRVLDFRAAGDAWIVDADIADCFGSLAHEIVMDRINVRVRDKRMLALVRMWLDTGQVWPQQGEAAVVPLWERMGDYATGAVNDAITHMLHGPSYGGYSYEGYGTYPTLPLGAAPLEPVGDEAELRRAARKEAFKRLGRDAALLGLTFAGRLRRLLSPTTLAVAGVAVLATVAYPVVRDRFGRRIPGVGAAQGSALSPLLANIVLHELDVALVKAGFHLTRYADDFVITCRDEQEARQALDAAARKLGELRLQLNPAKTRIIRFEQGLEFLGYKFDQFQLTATPAPTHTQPPISVLLREAPNALSELKAKAAPSVTSFGRRALEGAKARAERLAAWANRRADK